MDDTMIPLLLVGVLFACALTFLAGRWSDPVWQAKFRSRFDRKPYMVLGIVAKDGCDIQRVVVNPLNDCVLVNGHLWVLKESRIYQDGKPQSGFHIPGVTSKARDEGIMTVFVDRDSLKPLSFHREETDVRPLEVGTALLGFLAAWKAASKRDEGLDGILRIVTVLGIAACLIGVYIIHAEVTEAKKEAASAKESSNYLIDRLGFVRGDPAPAAPAGG